MTERQPHPPGRDHLDNEGPDATRPFPAGARSGGSRLLGQPSDDALHDVHTDRGTVITRGLKASAAWAVRLSAIGIGLYLLFWLLSQVWVGVRPIILAIILSTIFWPPVAWLRKHRWPPALAAAAVLLAGLAVAAGVIAAIAPSLLDQATDIADSASRGIETVRRWLSGPPISLSSERIDEAVASATDRLRDNATDIAGGVLTGVSALTSTIANTLLVLVLTFFFIKDGPAFLPWVRREAGNVIGRHLTEVLVRTWKTVGDFIHVQALVSFIDALLIGLGLLILGVPLAPALAVLTFIAGFVPIVGAIAAGGLAVLVALFTNGPTTALLVLALIILVQQVEGNVLQPLLQGKSLQLHAAVVLLAIAAGGTLFGITGAFLAVPAAAVTVTLLRYLSQQISLRTGEVSADEIENATPEGSEAARRTEHQPHRPSSDSQEGDGPA